MATPLARTAGTNMTFDHVVDENGCLVLFEKKTLLNTLKMTNRKKKHKRNKTGTKIYLTLGEFNHKPM